MLLTNHGDLAQALLHPRYHVPKTYLIKVKGVLDDAKRSKLLNKASKLEDGFTAPATKVNKVSKAESNSWLEVTIHEGRKHQVKRMVEAVGHSVIKLVRVRMGPLLLGDLAPREYRFLTDREANRLRDLVEDRVAKSGTSGTGRPENRLDGCRRRSRLRLVLPSPSVQGVGQKLSVPNGAAISTVSGQCETFTLRSRNHAALESRCQISSSCQRGWFSTDSGWSDPAGG